MSRSDNCHARFDDGHFPKQLHDVMREILDWSERDLGHVTGLKSS